MGGDPRKTQEYSNNANTIFITLGEQMFECVHHELAVSFTEQDKIITKKYHLAMGGGAPLEGGAR